MDEIRNNLKENTEEVLKQNPQKITNNKITSEEILKSSKESHKKNVTISTENANTTNTVLKKVKEVFDKTVEDVKEVAKENVRKNANEENKREQIENIKKITNEAIDEINKLTKFIVEQANALIEKIYGKGGDKISFKSIKKEKKILCKKCSSITYNSDFIRTQDKEKLMMNKVHKGIRCNGCGNFIWESY